MKECCQLQFSPESLDDLRAIYSYIAFRLKEENAAKRQVARIRSRILALRELPDRFATVDWEPWASLGIRKAPVDNYVVYYAADRERLLVSIVRILYVGRDAEGMTEKES